jgi:tetratricopeptide (TPR) repeat protein
MLVLIVGFRTYSVAEPDPDQHKSISAMSVAELDRAADLARAEKDYRRAMEYFRAAIAKDPKNATLYNKLGMTELKAGSMYAARADFQKAAKLNPKYANAMNNLGAVEYSEKKYGAALKYFKKAVALEETSATFHVNLGSAWFAQNKVDRALAEYTRALELDPEVLNSSSRMGVVAQMTTPEERAKYSYMLAKIYAKRGDFESCLRCLRKAKEDGYPQLANVYKDEEFASLRQDARLSEVVPPPVAK